MQTRNEMIVEPIGLEPDTLPKPLEWATLFGNDHPVEMEIGMGKGTFLTEAARAHPEANFFGIEWARWYWRYASDRLRRHNCLNARTVRAEAGFFIREFVRDASLAVLHIYFPDPWPKKRHHKRRLIQPPFVALLASRMKPGATVHTCTDWEEYAQQMLQVLSADRALENTASGYAERPDTRPETKFERRGLGLRHRVWDLAFRKI